MSLRKSSNMIDYFIYLRYIFERRIRLKINIKPINYSFSNCFEAILANIAVWDKRNYELMYINEWNFKFNLLKEGVANRLGNSLNSFCDIRNTLYFYHGIKFTQYECLDFANLIDIINQQLLSKPITVRMDTFYCPWDKSYRKHHNVNHIFFINGIDNDRRTIFCTDPFYLIQDEKISFEDFAKGYNNQYGIFEFEDDNSKSMDGGRLIENILISLINNKTFEKIRFFAKELKKIKSLSNELEGFQEAWQAPLYYNIAGIANSRKRIPVLIVFIANNYNCKELISCSDELYSISLKWNSLKDLILKMFILDNISETKSRIVNNLEDIANREEEIAKKLLNICRISICK